MQLAMIIFLLCWLFGMGRQFIHIGNAETLAEECAEVGIGLIWAVILFAALAAYNLKELP